jgi:radical SAM protein with 4Fe4S-binding SPASM domain
MARRYGVKTIIFANFEPSGRTDEFCRRESMMDKPDEVLPHWESARARATEVGIFVPALHFAHVEADAKKPHESQPMLYDETGRMRNCPIPWWGTHIDTNGSITPCCVWPPERPMGNLLEQPFRTIWNGRRYRELRRTVNTPNMPEPCTRCFLPVRL